MSKEIGTLKRVNIKSVWPNEERDFTPWLKNHGLKQLLEQLGIDDMIEANSEVHCGDGGKSEADLVVVYPDGEERKTLVIENQYGKSDADHLGRLLMYSAHQNASDVVWITEEERPEYVATINWLNDNCASESAFRREARKRTYGNSNIFDNQFLSQYRHCGRRRQTIAGTSMVWRDVAQVEGVP